MEGDENRVAVVNSATGTKEVEAGERLGEPAPSMLHAAESGYVDGISNMQLVRMVHAGNAADIKNTVRGENKEVVVGAEDLRRTPPSDARMSGHAWLLE